MDPTMREVGRRLREARQAARLSCPQIAQIVQRTPQQIRCYERGASQPPVAIMAKWAEATDKAIAWFFQFGTSGDNDGVRLPGPITHPGVEALADDIDLRVEAGVTNEMIEMLRSFRGQLLGKEIVIHTRADALAIMEKMRKYANL